MSHSVGYFLMQNGGSYPKSYTTVSPITVSPPPTPTPPPLALLHLPNTANPSKQLGDLGRTAEGRKNTFSQHFTNGIAEHSILSMTEKNTGFRIIFYISLPQCKCLNVWIFTLRIAAKMAITENSES